MSPTMSAHRQSLHRHISQTALRAVDVKAEAAPAGGTPRRALTSMSTGREWVGRCCGGRSCRLVKRDSGFCPRRVPGQVIRLRSGARSCSDSLPWWRLLRVVIDDLHPAQIGQGRRHILGKMAETLNDGAQGYFNKRAAHHHHPHPGREDSQRHRPRRQRSRPTSSTRPRSCGSLAFPIAFGACLVRVSAVNRVRSWLDPCAMHEWRAGPPQ